MRRCVASRARRASIGSLTDRSVGHRNVLRTLADDTSWHRRKNVWKLEESSRTGVVVTCVKENCRLRACRLVTHHQLAQCIPCPKLRGRTEMTSFG